jgi:hypothetical protein
MPSTSTMLITSHVCIKDKFLLEIVKMFNVPDVNLLFRFFLNIHLLTPNILFTFVICIKDNILNIIFIKIQLSFVKLPSIA